MYITGDMGDVSCMYVLIDRNFAIDLFEGNVEVVG